MGTLDNPLEALLATCHSVNLFHWSHVESRLKEFDHANIVVYGRLKFVLDEEVSVRLSKALEGGMFGGVQKAGVGVE